MSEKLKHVSGEKSEAGGRAPVSQNFFAWSDRFVQRHLGPNADETRQMLETCGFKTLDALIDVAVPAQIRLRHPLQLPPSRSEYGLLDELRQLASQNRLFRSFIGLGYHDCITPPVIQ